MVKQSVEERRNGIRAKRILSIQYRLVKKSKNKDNNWRLSTTEDMSVTGLAFLSEQAFTPGDILEVQVVMSGVLDIYNGLAKVVRTDRKREAAYYLVGVKFTGSKTKSRNAKSYNSAQTNRLKRLSGKK
ncbi:MAG: hypothetical protein A2787_02650 [Omnitrophica WOR_2 bacterium RIFCSPHIGHO2_01_FULL_48_9]|nr:MAG: hypothetical protein A3D10_08410 [Omnitrophica WOR_2 bacterium RIFCSPHIGHO2_02_FULL_48_11]OGX30996.1 MAG: hypothetical protein A2787_02650 [Omnitrophica WOR_2 bacterium RIFCSPHIGHO2_01_FULL_48_9]